MEVGRRAEGFRSISFILKQCMAAVQVAGAAGAGRALCERARGANAAGGLRGRRALCREVQAHPGASSSYLEQITP